MLRRPARRQMPRARRVLVLGPCIRVFVFSARLALVSRRRGGVNLADKQKQGEEGVRNRQLEE